MNALELYKLCKQAGIDLSVDGENLRVTTAQGMIPESIKSLLREHKQAMIELLAGDRDHGGPVATAPNGKPVLSYAQLRLWFQQLYDEQSAVYNIPLVLESDARLDEERLRSALRWLIERHEPLRTVIRNDNGTAEASLLDPSTFDIAVHEDDGRDDGVASLLVRQQTQRAFDLSADFMLRADLLQRAGGGSQLLITLHHIAADGWSLDILVDELNRAYDAGAAGQGPSVDPLPIRFSDYAAWQSDRLEGAHLDAQLAYWTRRLAHAPEIHQFPTDKPRPTSPEFRGDRLRFELDETTSRALQDLARRHGCTLFSLLQAAYAVFVARYSDTRDVVFGTPVANRTLSEVAGLIGFFANVVPMRTTLAEGQTFVDLLSQVHADAVADISRHDIPLEMLIDALKVVRSASYNPLFQMMFSFEDVSVGGAADGTVRGTRTLRRSGRERSGTGSKFDLTLIARNTASGLAFAWEYSHDLFEASSIQRFAANFVRLLRSIAADPSSRVDDLQLLCDEERAFLDAIGTGPRVAVEQPCVHRLFEHWARAIPDAIAVVHGETRLSYRELDERANRLAWALIGQGVRKGDIVGLCLRHASFFPVATLAVMKAGAAYLPMDPGYPAHRIAHIVRDSGAALWLSDETADLLAPYGSPTLDIAEAMSAGSDAQRASPEIDVGGDDLAYLIYTSGSTGLPKGTLLEHKGAVSLAQAQRALFDLCAEGESRSVVLQFSSISFDAATWELLMALGNGACLVVPDADDRHDPVAMARLVARHGVSHALFPPVYLAEFNDGDLPSIHHLMVGGEAIRHAEAVRWSRGRTFHNAYGPTESTICATVGRYQGGRVHMGRPIANHRCVVLDHNGRRVPVGALGELHLGGIGLARGYLNNDELTQARFVRMRIDGAAPERWYRTGDLVRWLADGNLEYVGRTDNQVKIRGFRVELGEIESALTAHPAIAAGFVCVLPADESRTEQQLAAYYSFSDASAPIDRVSVRQYLDQRLPDYMVPSVYVPLDAIPMTIHGKVDTARLPAPSDADVARRDYVPPATDLQRLVCAVLEDLLPATRVGIRDNFFELGGDSILSIRAVARINALGHNLTSRQFFDARTVETIAELLDAGAGQRASFPQAACEGALELLPIQRRFFELQSGFESRYLQSALLLLPNGADETFFAEFMPAIQQRHDMLRARFARTADGAATASFASSADVDPMAAFHVEDMSDLDADARSRFLQERGDAHKAAIDIEGGRLFAFVLFKARTAGDSRLLIIFHHLIVDGVSWRILLDDLKFAFEQHRAGQRIALSQKGTSYQQWSRLIAGWGGDVAEAAAGDPAVTCERLLATADARPGEVSDTLADTATAQASLDPSETRMLLQDCHRAYRTQINDLLLAALSLALDRWQGIASPDVFMESHGRDEDLFDGVDLSHCLGWFTSLYPIRLPACTGPDAPEKAAILGAKDALRRVHHMGLSHLASGHRTGTMGIVFNYLGQFDQQLGSANLFGRASEPTGYDVDRRRRREHLIGFNGRVAEGRLVFGIDFNRHLFQPERIASLASHFEAALRDLLAHCTQQTRSWASPSDFPACDVARQDLDQWQGELGEIEDLYPASGNQLGMLYHAQLDGHSSYAPQNLLHFPEDFDPRAFKRAWSTLVARHAVLRTVFVGPDLEQGLQLVLARYEPEWIEHDIASLAPDAQDARIAEYLLEDKRTPFDSRRVPLTRYALFKRDGGRHLFVWTCSHAILDGWSLGIVYEELFALYDAYRDQREPQLPAAPNYANYIRWTMGRNAEDAHAFWAREMEDAAPRDRIGIEAPALPEGLGKSVLKRALPAGDHEAMKRFAARHRITVNTLVQAAWAYWLARCGDVDTIVTGITLSGRPADLPGVEAMVGLMVNTVPAAIRIPREQTIVAWLQALHEQQSDREQYGFMPLSEIVKLKALDDGQSIFNTVLGFHSQPVERAADAMQKRGTKGGVGHDETHYPLVLGVSPHAGLHLTLTYDASLFERAAMERLCDQLGQILRGLVADGDRTVGDLDMLGDDERAALVALSEGPAPERASVLLPEMIRTWAAQRGDAPAVQLEDEVLSHAELEARSNRIARALVAAGVQVGDRVGVCQERTLEMVASVIGTMKAGAVYVPLDPGYPDERLAYLLSDAGIGHVLTEAYLAPQLPLSGQRVVLVSEAAAQDGGAYASPVDRGTVAYMIYTSGSTGQPKGVCVSHGALADKLPALAQHYGLSSADRGLLFASLSFDASLSQLLVPLSVGGSVSVRPDGVTEPSALLSYVASQGVTWMHVVPAYLRQLVEVEGWSRTSLRRVTSGGDVLDAGLREAWFTAERSGIALHNSYGPTEVTITSSVYRLRGDESVVGIGRPLANVRYWVLDERGGLLPRGAVGELCIGGSGVAEGYWGRELQTSERFVSLSVVPGREERVYRTGDRVRWGEAGQLEFVGRADHQVKVRGYRIELGEVESALRACAGVTGAVVKVEDDGLWAYVSLSGTDLGHVESTLSQRLPGYMLPSGYEKVEEWPLTRSGKIDRGALRRGHGGAPKRRGPANEVEEALLEIWVSLLKSDDIGVTDNFFQRGGHSLLATRLASQIRRRFEVDFTLKSLFELPSIEEQGRLIASQKSQPDEAASSSTRLPPIRPVGHDGPVALSFAQNSLWLLDQMENASASYITGTSLTITGDIDRNALEQAFQAIVSRHKILRTVIREHQNGARQEVLRDHGFNVEYVDLSHLAPSEATAALLRVRRDAKSRRFDLSKDVMLRVHLVRQAEDRHALLIHMHHIVCDGWSVGVLMRDFNALYRACREGMDASTAEALLPALPIQYRDYAQWQRERLSGANLDQLVEYWKTRLDGIPTLHQLSTDHERPDQQSYRGDVYRHRVGGTVGQGLKRLCGEHGATFFMGMHAAFATWLSRHSGASDIVLGAAVANREQSEVANLIGFFSNSIVLRSTIVPEESFHALLARTKTQDIADFDHQQLPFELLTEKLNPERSLSHNPIFQIVLNVDNNDVDRIDLNGSGVEGNSQLGFESNFDLTLYAAEQGDGIRLVWRYATDLFRAETIARMANSFETLLTAVVADPERPLHALPLVDEDERAALLALSEGPAPEHASVLLPEMIRTWAAQRGDAPAVQLEDEVLSYAELEARSNRIARALVAAGVQVGDRVGVCQERTLEMVASVIGTMKAGAVYVPLDPGYPDERLAYLLSDAGIGHVLTEAYLAPQLPLSGQRVVLVSEAASQDGGAYASPVDRGTVAYMIYTSGSTGQPKGVCVSHGALADKLPALAQHYGLSSADRGLLFASLSFDASLSQLLVPLSVGGSVSVRPDGVTEPSALLSYVASQGVTWMHVVPAYLRQLVEVEGWSRTSLRRVTSGGDVLDAGLREAWFTAERSGIALHNSYGPTEVTITSSVYRLRGDESVVGIGRPLANVRYWVLDERGGLLPRGAVGELCIGGSGVAEGYWGRESQTQERFVSLSVVPGREERVYRTGDRVRWGEAGQLEFVGRADHQVKVRGYRIELGEVESALRACAGVTGAVVKVEDDGLWAYVSLSGTDLGHVESTLSQRLPGYMLPSGYEKVEEWPLTRSGKIDRGALRRGHGGAPKRRGPANEVEEALLEIWVSLLKSDDIGVTDNFFQRGGHSLLATRLASQIRRRFEVDFTLKSLFELPSIEAQAQMLVLLKPSMLERCEDVEEFDV